METKRKILIGVCLMIFIAASFFIYNFSRKISFEKVKDSVVLIKVYNENYILISTGSGVVAYEKDVVLTNAHVVENASRIEIITEDNEIMESKGLLYNDEDKDIAIIKLKEKKLRPLKISKKELKTGDKIHAIGSPLGLKNTVSEGIISSEYIQDEHEFYQHTSPISVGNSGGALVNKRGELVGINFATFTEGQNLNLAIKIKDYTELYNNAENNAPVKFDHVIDNDLLFKDENGTKLYNEVCSINSNCKIGLSDLSNSVELEPMKESLEYIKTLSAIEHIESDDMEKIKEYKFKDFLNIFIFKINDNDENYANFIHFAEQLAMEMNDNFYNVELNIYYVRKENYYSFVLYNNIKSINYITKLLNELEV